MDVDINIGAFITIYDSLNLFRETNSYISCNFKERHVNLPYFFLNPIFGTNRRWFMPLHSGEASQILIDKGICRSHIHFGDGYADRKTSVLNLIISLTHF
jgi:hypothetical protein